MKTKTLVRVVLVSVALVACDEPTGPENTVEVRMLTSGVSTDVDPDGYLLHLGASTYPVPANGTLTIPDVVNGTHEVQLTDVAANCTSQILSRRLLTIPTDPQVARPHVSFSAKCLPDLGTVRVTIKTTGAEPDTNGYAVLFRGELGIASAVSVKPDAVAEGVLPSGEFQLSVEGIADNCRVEGEERSTVVVQHARFTDIALHVTCVARGVISISARALGEFPDADGYNFIVTKDEHHLRSGHLGTNGTLSLSGFAPGIYDVSLINVAVNCDPPPSIAVPVRSAETTAVPFDVSCATPFDIAYAEGELNVTSITTITTDGRLKRVVMDEGGPEADPAFSPDGRRIAYTRIRGLTSKVNVVDADDGGNRIELASGEGFDHHPAWSPDGGEVVFVRNHVAGSSIYIMGANGSNVRRITNETAFDADPDWSPDGKQIVFARRFGDLAPSIYVMNADGSAVTKLTSGNLSDQGPAWSPDGTLITFARRHTDMLYGIHIMDSSGNNTRLLAEMSSARDPAWSPDGKMIAFSGEPFCTDYYYYYCYLQIHFVRLDGTLPGPVGSGFADSRSPTFRPRR